MRQISKWINCGEMRCIVPGIIRVFMGVCYGHDTIPDISVGSQGNGIALSL